jgi:hypothetical protein
MLVGETTYGGLETLEGIKQALSFPKHNLISIEKNSQILTLSLSLVFLSSFSTHKFMNTHTKI